MLLISVAAGFLVYNDFKDLEKGFTEESKLVLLVDNKEKEVITGLEFQKFDTEDNE